MTQEAQYEFDLGFQRKIAALFVNDSTFAMSNKDVLDPKYFTEAAMGTIIAIVQDHVRVYKSAPGMKLLPQLLKDAKLANKIRPDQLDDIKDIARSLFKADLSSPAYVSDKVSSFAKHQAIEQAMMASIPHLEKGRFVEIEQLMKKALAVGAVNDGDKYNYFDEIATRTQEREDIKAGKIVRDGIPTGHSQIDGLLYHYGWGRRELSCIMGAAKAGKSLSLGEFTKNAALAGYNVLYDSLEVSKKIIASRIDAAISDTMMRDLHKDPQKVAAAVAAMKSKSGAFEMRDNPSGMLKPSQLHRLIEEYRSDGIMLDLVTVDYADIMAAEYRSDNQIENLRSIYIDLRAIAHEFNCAVLTATQTNREGAKSASPKATDVGDDWNKARTVDILLGISATEAEKQAGEARISWLLSRNTEDGFSLKIRQDRSRMQFLKSVVGKV